MESNGLTRRSPAIGRLGGQLIAINCRPQAQLMQFSRLGSVLSGWSGKSKGEPLVLQTVQRCVVAARMDNDFY